jgi:prepilin-type N-terminal cleavage/methylation domain-containing protein
MKKNSYGFSLLELMIVITIISILAATAIPSYQRYIKKARFAEIIAIAQAFKTAVTIALQEGFELDQLAAGKYGIPPEPPKTKNLANLIIEKGIITATATDLIENATYILKPNIDGSLWSLGGSCLKLGLCHE